MNKPCGCPSDSRPCAKACGLDMTGWFCEADAARQVQEKPFIIHPNPASSPKIEFKYVIGVGLLILIGLLL